MKLLFTALALVILSSCGGNSGSPNSDRSRNPMCGTKATLCAEKVEWTIDSTALNFPEHFELSVNNDVWLNTCKGARPEIENTAENRKLIRLTYGPYINNQLDLTITDLGSDCKNNAIFYAGEDLSYAHITIEVENRRQHAFSVKLSN